MRRPVRPSERGAALLAVLLLVAIMGALAAAAFERVRLSTALALNGAALDQARAYAIGVEGLLALRIDDLAAESPDLTNLEGNWNGTRRTIPLPAEGSAEGTIRDGGNCFNLNSLVEGGLATGLKRRDAGAQQFSNLMVVLGLPEPKARAIAGAAADWADGDGVRGPDGAEDEAYAAGDPAYRSGNTLFADPSELRAVAGVSPEIYRVLRPWLCALPVAELSPINVNTLLPAQAALLVMLDPRQAEVGRVRALLADRPARGWATIEDFWPEAAGAGIGRALDPMSQLQTRTAWFGLDLLIRFQGGEMEESALVDARSRPARIVARRWGSGE
ncbi:MAG TPA: type II secretion system minor pseudopilin GspK [Allosphingosinicella sp.]|nr:type II secretion system minor pseudopilin GspK [Allosphingosinicella sp.]